MHRYPSRGEKLVALALQKKGNSWGHYRVEQALSTRGDPDLYNEETMFAFERRYMNVLEMKSYPSVMKY